MNYSRSLAAFAAGLLLLATAPAMAATSTLTIPISALNGSGETGSAVLTQTADGVQVVVTLKGAPADAQPTHIHAGTCGKINAAPEWPLTSLTDGTSTSVVKGVTIDQMLKTPYAINVHKSTSDLGTYVACGNIVAGK
jgi:Cu/Zn superoxide dismutase